MSIEAPNGREITPKKMVVIRAGIGPEGGSISIKAVTKAMERTESNTRQHIVQCAQMYGFEYKTDGDRYWIILP